MNIRLVSVFNLGVVCMSDVFHHVLLYNYNNSTIDSI